MPQAMRYTLTFALFLLVMGSFSLLSPQSILADHQFYMSVTDQAKYGERVEVRIGYYFGDGENPNSVSIIFETRDGFGKTAWFEGGKCGGIDGRECKITATMPSSGPSPATLLVCRKTAGPFETVSNCRDPSKVKLLGQHSIVITNATGKETGCVLPFIYRQGTITCAITQPQYKCTIGDRLYCCPHEEACKAQTEQGDPFNLPPKTPETPKCGEGELKGVPTALGCIPTANLNEFAKWFLGWAIGIGGGIAFLLILWSGFQIMTSSGNPDRLKAGKEQLTAALTGLLFLIFSVFLLRLIGVEILRIPGLQ